MTTWLSRHFSLEELTATQHRGIDNSPRPSIVAQLTRTAERMEDVREILGGRPILVTSGYRCPALNLEVGGAKTSAHMTGQAVDFICPALGPPLAVCRAIAAAAGVRRVRIFDQMIEEGTWVHLSFAPAMRGEILTKRRGGGYGRGLGGD